MCDSNPENNKLYPQNEEIVKKLYILQVQA